MVNDVIEIKIVELNINFEGVGFFNNKKVCVKNVLPEEVVRVKIIYEKENFIFATLVKIIVKNPLRIEPYCKHYYLCGGCSLQILGPKDALKLKADVVKSYFSNFFSGSVIIHESKNDFYYRNKVSFGCKDDLIIGLKRENSNEVVNIDECVICDKIINKILNILKNFLKEMHIKIKVKNFVIRQFDNSFILTIVVKNKIENIKIFDLLIKNLEENFSKNSFGIFINYNSSNKEILGRDWQHIYGIKKLNIKLMELDIDIHPYSFLQVNYDIMQKLYNRVVDFVGSGDVVVEGFSGAGLLSSLIAKKAKEVYSIEINKSATKDANLHKGKNNLHNLHNINGSCSEIIPKLNLDYENSVFVMDPPQSGCDTKVLDTIIKNKIEKVIYVSCNPYTLKQNVYYLKDYYKIENLEIFDMFPNTSHCESVCILERR